MYYVTSTYRYTINPDEKPLRFIVKCESLTEMQLTQNYFLTNPDYKNVTLLTKKPYYSKSRYQVRYVSFEDMEKTIYNYFDLIMN